MIIVESRITIDTDSHPTFRPDENDFGKKIGKNGKRNRKKRKNQIEGINSTLF